MVLGLVLIGFVSGFDVSDFRFGVSGFGFGFGVSGFAVSGFGIYFVLLSAFIKPSLDLFSYSLIFLSCAINLSSSNDKFIILIFERTKNLFIFEA